MTDIMDILTSGFFWGVVVGVALSILGAYAGARFTIKAQNDEHRRRTRNFSIELVENVRKVVDELDDHRTRSRIIFHDFLALLDTEISIYGRNRESFILLDRNTRTTIQKFMSDAAIRRAEIAQHLLNVQNASDRADHHRSANLPLQAQVAEDAVSTELDSAHKAVDRLVQVAARSQDVVAQIVKDKDGF